MAQAALKESLCKSPAPAALDEEESRRITLARCNDTFDRLNARQRVEWSLAHLPDRHILTSSFGAQSAVALHLVTRVKADIPVVLIDTGYLFPETYRFIDALVERLSLNLAVYRADVSPAWQEARHGKRWEQGAAGIAAYNEEAKVEPMRRALRELEVGTWFAGLRRSQSNGRANTPYLEWAGDRWKVHPIADWSDRDVYRYLKRHDLPYNPLWERGYLSIGDYHTTRSIHEVGQERDLRFFGVQRECGLHEIDLSEV
ncbi:MAG TPA: phosphoadenylyl-sulfate reductase [Woeseiaceae bacterium]|nr:phosphoadenylyl-sulfate reductase [Woeseiaceae bacterium]